MLEESDFENPHMVRSCCCKQAIDINSVKVGLQVFSSVFIMFFSSLMIYVNRNGCNDTWGSACSCATGRLQLPLEYAWKAARWIFHFLRQKHNLSTPTDLRNDRASVRPIYAHLHWLYLSMAAASQIWQVASGSSGLHHDLSGSGSVATWNVL